MYSAKPSKKSPVVYQSYVDPTEAKQSNSLGGVKENSYGNIQCKFPAYVNEVYGYTGGFVDQLCMKCSDGKDLGCNPGGRGDRKAPLIQLPNGFNRMSTYYHPGWGMGRLTIGDNDGYTLGQKTDGDFRSYGVIECPEDMIAVGYGGYHGGDPDIVEETHLMCNYNPDTYCVYNLESDFCKNIPGGVSTRVLQQACAKNLTDTCKSRKNELTDSIVQKYCGDHKDDPFCSCYLTPPNTLDPPTVRGIPQCWNSQCATMGYIPSNIRNSKCPDNITVCKQEFNAGGEGNLLSGVELKSTCGNTAQPSIPPSIPPSSPSKPPSSPSIPPSPPSSPFQPPSTPSMPSIPGNNSTTGFKFLGMSSTTLIVLFLVFVLCIGGYIYIDSDENDETENNSNGVGRNTYTPNL